MRNINQYEEIIELIPFYFQIGFKIVISYFQAQPLSSGYPLTLNLNEISRQELLVIINSVLPFYKQDLKPIRQPFNPLNF